MSADNVVKLSDYRIKKLFGEYCDNPTLEDLEHLIDACELSEPIPYDNQKRIYDLHDGAFFLYRGRLHKILKTWRSAINGHVALVVSDDGNEITLPNDTIIEPIAKRIIKTAHHQTELFP